MPGLILGGRAVGPEHDVQAEPMIGYRRTFGAERNVSGLAIVHAARGKATDGGASYTATRVGAEVAADLRVLGEGRWLEPHLFAAVSITGLSADGAYCVDPTGRYGIDCPEPPATAPGRRRCLRRLPGRDRGPRAPRHRASRQLVPRRARRDDDVDRRDAAPGVGDGGVAPRVLLGRVRAVARRGRGEVSTPPHRGGVRMRCPTSPRRR